MSEIVNISSDFSFSYSGNQPLLKTIDELCLDQGSIYGIYGDNGSGKTTLLNILNTMLCPTTGTIRYSFNGLEYQFGPSSAKLMPGLIANNIRRSFQVPFLIDEWTVSQNILLSKRDYPQEQSSKVFSLFDKTDDELLFQLLDIGGFTGQELAEDLSYGQRRLVSNLQMLYCRASLTILDEPFANIHTDVIKNLQAKYREFVRQDNATIIVVEHKRNVIEQFAHKIISTKNKELRFEN